MAEALPAVAARPVIPAEMGPEARKVMGEIDLKDTTSVISFGSKAQADLQKVSEGMLEGVRNKDSGPAGESIANMVTLLRGFSVSKDDLRDKPTLMERLMSRVAPAARFRAKFESVSSQIERIALDLEGHKTRLMTDLLDLDKLYEKTLAFYDALRHYIEAGEARIAHADAVEIPAAERAMSEATDDNDRMLLANGLRDLRQARDDLERRVHDLRLTRQVTMQSLPSIRLIQENDKSLVTKISSTLTNTVPLWKTQIAQAITIGNAAKAAGAVRSATDLTNELLLSNAKNLRQTNATVRIEAERGIFDIEAIARANSELIGTLEDSLRIADAGKLKRKEGEAALVGMEGDLRRALTAAKSRD